MQYLERRRVARFLKGLNSKFEARRTAICHLSSLPSLNEVIASMEEEEIRQKVMASETSLVVRSAMAFPRAQIRDDRICFNCGEKGHLNFNCPAPCKSGGGRGGKGQKNGYGGRGRENGYRGRGTRGHGGRGVAHFAVTEEPQAATNISGAELTELEELRRFKSQVESSKGKATVSDEFDSNAYFGNIACYTHMTKGAQAQAFASTKSHVDWIIDSGASSHITGSSSEFVEYCPSQQVQLETVQTADGTSQSIKGIGSVQLACSFFSC